jgi:type IV secretion system protein VirB6
MPACAPISPAAGSAETMVATVDCYVQSGVQAGYASLLGPGSAFGTALTIALTLYVAFVGYRLIFGRAGLSIGELAPRMLLIGAVLALTSNWATYQVLVYDVLTDGPEEIASAINPGAGKADLNERVDMLSGRMVDLADAWTEFDAQVRAEAPAAPAALPATAAETLPASANGAIGLIAPRDSLGPNMLLVSALLLVLASAGVLVIAKIILGLLLLLGPIFALLGLFAGTRGLTLGWARAAVMMALVPVMATMTTAGAVALLEPIVIEMYVAAGEGVFSLRAAVTVMVVLLVMVAVSVQLFRIGRTIVGGWTVGLGQSVPENAPSVMAPGAATADAAPLVYNERMQALVGSIERAAIANSTANTATPQRQILLPARRDNAAAPTAATAMQPDRRVARGRVSAVRAPIKPVRNAA